MGRRGRRYRREGHYLFVDGYNIINHWSSLKEVAVHNLEDARLLLADQLAEYAHFTGIHIILVYDAYQVKHHKSTIYHHQGIEVVFTKEHQTADHYIERELQNMGRVREVTVATSDNMEQQLILARGGQRISARELEIEVKRQQGEMNRTMDKIRSEEEPFENKLDLEDLEIINKINHNKKR